MIQKVPHFLLAEIYFGSIDDFEAEVDEEGTEIAELLNPCILVLNTHPTKISDQNIGIFFPQIDSLN